MPNSSLSSTLTGRVRKALLMSILASNKLLQVSGDVLAPHLSPWYPRGTPLSIPFSISFTQFGSVWNFNSSANCWSRKGVIIIICLSGLQLGGVPAGWVFPSTASCVANMLELACLCSCTAPGGIKADADFGSCGCVCECLWLGQDVRGWLVCCNENSCVFLWHFLILCWLVWERSTREICPLCTYPRGLLCL